MKFELIDFLYLLDFELFWFYIPCYGFLLLFFPNFLWILIRFTDYIYVRNLLLFIKLKINRKEQILGVLLCHFLYPWYDIYLKYLSACPLLQLLFEDQWSCLLICSLVLLFLWSQIFFRSIIGWYLLSLLCILVIYYINYFSV